MKTVYSLFAKKPDEVSNSVESANLLSTIAIYRSDSDPHIYEIESKEVTEEFILSAKKLSFLLNLQYKSVFQKDSIQDDDFFIISIPFFYDLLNSKRVLNPKRASSYKIFTDDENIIFNEEILEIFKMYIEATNIHPLKSLDKKNWFYYPKSLINSLNCPLNIFRVNYIREKTDFYEISYDGRISFDGNCINTAKKIGIVSANIIQFENTPYVVRPRIIISGALCKSLLLIDKNLVQNMKPINLDTDPILLDTVYKLIDVSTE
jgi:hypothetical protein